MPSALVRSRPARKGVHAQRARQRAVAARDIDRRDKGGKALRPAARLALDHRPEFRLERDAGAMAAEREGTLFKSNNYFATLVPSERPYMRDE